MITKRTKIMLGVLVLVAIGAYAYLYWWSQTDDHGYLDSVPAIQNASDKASDTVIRPRPTTPTTPTTNPGENVTYRSYENTEFGFSFDYPETWVTSLTKVNTLSTLCIKETEATGDCKLTVTFEKESVNKTADVALDAFEDEFRKGTITDSTRRIAGEEGTVLRISGYAKGEENSTRAGVFVHDKQVYTIETAGGQEALFDRVVSSFAFKK